MSYALIDTTDLTTLGNAIRAKTGDTATMAVSAMATAVNGISVGSSAPEKGIIFQETTNEQNQRVLDINCYGNSGNVYLSLDNQTCYYPIGNCCGWDLKYYQYNLINVNILDQSVNVIPAYFMNCVTYDPSAEIALNNINPIQIEKYSFYRCKMASGLNSFLSHIVQINQYAFGNARNLGNIELPNTIKFIDAYSFAYSDLTTLTISLDVLEEIASRAFTGCDSLTTVYFIGNKLSSLSINTYTFRNSVSLTDIYVPWSENDVAGAPWGATNATVHYNYVPAS